MKFNLSDLLIEFDFTLVQFQMIYEEFYLFSMIHPFLFFIFLRWLEIFIMADLTT